jgi:rod shape determining protein RodA
MSTLARTLRDQFDWALFVAVFGIATCGIINLYSATSAPGAVADMYIQQMYWLALGTGVAVLVCIIDYRHFERYGFIIYGVGVSLLILVLTFGEGIRGSRRWIKLGSFTLQPSELMKIGLIIALAKYLHHDPKSDGRTLKDLLPPAMILALPMVLIIKQPDLGTSLMCAFIFGSIMVLTNLKTRSLVTLGLGFVVSAPLAWQFLLHDYQKARLTTFMDLWASDNPDILGDAWHAYQSLVSIGSGGISGKGFLHGTQNQFGFMPDQYSDFPFPVWAEENGLFGALIVISLYLFIVLWGLRIASQAKDRFGAVVAVGVSALIFWHAVINIGMVMAMLPVVGMPLPLFSYGGSSVLTIMIGIGLLMNVSMRRFQY